jgi:hypothetical membrane protein
MSFEEEGTGRRSMAGVLLSGSAAVILMGIITAEALYPAGYSTHGNEISDLGATRPPDSVIHQPSAAIFDGTMLLAGALIVAAALLLRGRMRRRAVPIWLGLFGTSVCLVGVFPGDTAPHPLVATATFLSAGVAALVAARSQSAPASYVSTALGTATLASMALGYFLLDWGPVAELGDGGIERWIAYPAVLWLAVFGGTLMSAGVARPVATEPDRAPSRPAEAPRTGGS